MIRHVENTNGSGLDSLIYFWASPDFDESKEIRLYVDPAMEDVLLPVGVRINENSFPDDDFRRYVSTYADTDGDGWISPDEIEAVTNICMEEDYDLRSVKGIEYFTALTSLIIDSNDNLMDLDLSANTGLTHVEVWNNRLLELNLDGLTALRELSVDGNMLSGLDVSGFNLTELYCYGNRLLSLKLGDQPELRILHCYSNTSSIGIDLRGCPLLVDAVINGTKTTQQWGVKYEGPLGGVVYVDTEMDLIVPGSIPIDVEHFPDETFRAMVWDNYDTNRSGWLTPDEIAAVDGFSCEDVDFTSIRGIEYFTELTSLLLDGAPSLTDIDLSGNTQLSYAAVSSNGLTALQINGLTSLNSLYVENNALTWLDVSELPLSEFYCHHNPLSTLILGHQPDLCRFFCQNTDLAFLDLRNCPLILDIIADGTRTVTSDYVDYKVDNNHWFRVGVNTELVLPGMIPVDESRFPDEVFRNYVSDHFDLNASGWLSSAEIADATEITLESYEGLTSVQGIEYLPELNYLCIGNEPLFAGIDLSANNKLRNLDVYNTGLTSLDVSGLQLEFLNCTRSRMTDLTLGSQPNLLYLSCYGNPGIKTLDLRHAPKLLDAVLNGTRTEPDWGDQYEGPLGGVLFVDAGTKLVISDAPEPTFFLPSALTAIENEAFSGIAAVSVYIPDSVTAIYGDPFSGSAVRYIYGIRGSEAESFASSHVAYTFVPVPGDRAAGR